MATLDQTSLITHLTSQKYATDMYDKAIWNVCIPTYSPFFGKQRTGLGVQ